MATLNPFLKIYFFCTVNFRLTFAVVFVQTTFCCNAITAFSCNTFNIAQGNYSEAVQYEQYLTREIFNHPQHFEIGLGCASTYFIMFLMIKNLPIQIFVKLVLGGMILSKVFWYRLRRSRDLYQNT